MLWTTQLGESCVGSLIRLIECLFSCGMQTGVSVIMSIGAGVRWGFRIQSLPSFFSTDRSLVWRAVYSLGTCCGVELPLVAPWQR